MPQYHHADQTPAASSRTAAETTAILFGIVKAGTPVSSDLAYTESMLADGTF
jgi:hypothetical protein